MKNKYIFPIILGIVLYYVFDFILYVGGTALLNALSLNFALWAALSHLLAIGLTLYFTLRFFERRR